MIIGTYTSIITSNVNGSMLQPKDIDWLNGYQNNMLSTRHPFQN